MMIRTQSSPVSGAGNGCDVMPVALARQSASASLPRIWRSSFFVFAARG